MKLITKILLSLFIVFTVTGCSKNNDTTLKIGILPNLDAIPILIAEKNGYFPDNIEIVSFTSALDRDTALQTNNLDGTASDIISALLLNSNNFSAKITSKTEGEFAIISSPNSNINSPTEITSGSIGISSNTIIEYITDVFTDTYDLSSIEKIAIPKIPIRLEMIKNNEIDFATLPEPLASSITNDGGSILTTSTELKTYPSVMIFSESSITEKNESIISFYEGYNKAVEYLSSTPKEDYFDYIIEEINLPKNIIDTFTLTKYNKAFLPTSEEFDSVQNWMLRNTLIETPLEYNEIINETFVNNI